MVDVDGERESHSEDIGQMQAVGINGPLRQQQSWGQLPEVQKNPWELGIGRVGKSF